MVLLKAPNFLVILFPERRHIRQQFIILWSTLINLYNWFGKGIWNEAINVGQNTAPSLTRFSGNSRTRHYSNFSFLIGNYSY